MAFPLILATQHFSSMCSQDHLDGIEISFVAIDDRQGDPIRSGLVDVP